MKRGGCAFLGCAVVLALALGAVVALPKVVSRLAERFASVEPEPPLEPEAVPEAVPEIEPSPEFQERRDFEFQGDDLLRVSYDFTDHFERPHQVSCAIRKQDHEREVSSFGYVEDQVAALLEQRVRSLVDREARARGLDSWFEFRLEAEDDSWKYGWSWSLPADRRDVHREAAAFDEWLEWNLPREIDAVADRLYRERGFRLRNDQVSIDYEQVAVRGTEPLADCFRALREEGRGSSDQRLLSLFLSFFQALRYQEPPEHELGRRTNGFWVPTEVLVRRAGDCDSKSVAFCALWRNLPKQAVIILVPGHALVAVEARPGPDEAFIQIGNRYFVLCEVAGPARTPPGGKAISGSFEYVLIEPAVRG
jgi:hypothetical protein